MSRITKRTPKFFRKLRNISLLVGSVAGAVLAAPVVLPAAVITGLTILSTVAGTAAVVSQSVTTEEKE